jgi:prolyl-tRNA synthetase
LQEEGVEVLLDDRDERPGIKFKDGDLIGIPYRVTIGKRFATEGTVEIRARADGRTESYSLEEAVTEVVSAIRTGLAETRE